MSRKRSGQVFICKYCGDEYYRRPSHVLRGITRTCGKATCKSADVLGERNPFWGKNHSPETLEKIAAGRTVGNRQKTGSKGYKHTKEAREKMSAASKERWLINRDMMLASRARGENHHFRKINYIPRYRQNFTEVQKREWKSDKCAYCTSIENLVLDHIIPVMAGGKRERHNAQTLCQPCNLWKMWFVDRPYYLSWLGSQGG